MKKIFFSLFVLTIASSCVKFDDSTLWDAVNKNAAEIAALKEKCSQMNSDISNLKALVTALQSNDYIIECSPLADGSGYSIVFNSGKSIIIKNGENGQTPDISVSLGPDGIYYWTLNGEWMTDEHGNKIQAQGINGKNAITPELKIEDGYWYISYDNKKTWTKLGKATGEDGKTLFKDVTEDARYVYITLVDGTVLTLQKKIKIEITFNEGLEIAIVPGGEKKITYSLHNTSNDAMVKAIGQNGWTAKVVTTGPADGYILVSAPDPMTDDEVLVIVYDGDGSIILKSLNFVEGSITVSDEVFNVKGKGGQYSMTVNSNIGCRVNIPVNIQDWVSYKIERGTKSMETINLCFTVSKNLTDKERAGVVEITDESGIFSKRIAFFQTVYDQFEDLTIGGETANCYIINEAGDYRFPIIKGNGQKGVILPGDTADITGAVRAVILWQDTEILESVGIRDNWVVLSTKEKLGFGNALVAVTDSYGTILWSWHIWSTDYVLGQGDKTVYNYSKTNSYKMMPLNLGMYSISTRGSWDGHDTGLFYQWGRKDPFPHRTANKRGTDGNTTNSIKNPTTYYTWRSSTAWRDENRYDWWDSGVSAGNSSTTKPSILKGSKTIYDPCPAGYRVPPDDAFTAFTKTGTAVESKEYINATSYSISNFFSDYCYDFYLNDGDSHMRFPVSGGLNASEGELLSGYAYYQCAHSAYYTIGRNLTFTYQMVSPMTATYSSALAGVIRPVRDEGISDYISSDYTLDRTTKTLMTHTKGNGIKVLIVGDGFTDLDVRSGKYDQKIQEACNYMFNVEPYSSFKEYFDVVNMRVISPSSKFDGSGHTALKCEFGSGTHITCDLDSAMDLGYEVFGKFENIHIVVAINDSRYAGTCWMFTNGTSVALVPTSEQYWDFEDVIHHEACGHGFAKLGDEYGSSGSATEDLRSDYEYFTSFGWYHNVDLTNDPANIKWSRFLSDPVYGQYVGIYEGGFTVGHGFYRPTYDSIMNQNEGEFNAPSRKLIYDHIMQLSGKNTSWEAFVEYDKKNLKGSNVRDEDDAKNISPIPFVPLAPPEIVNAEDVIDRVKARRSSSGNVISSNNASSGISAGR